MAHKIIKDKYTFFNVNDQYDSINNKILLPKINDNIKGIVTGRMNCWLSASASTADPTAANNDPYIKYPPKK